MGDKAEEQHDEVEALEAIYPDEFENLTTESSLKPKYRIHLVPEPGGENHVEVDLISEIPAEYPDILPELYLEGEKGLSKKQLETLLELATTTAEENLGMCSVFAICEAVRGWLLENNVAGQDGSMYSEMLKRMAQKDVAAKKAEEIQKITQIADSEGVEEEINEEELERIRRRQAGTAVTNEVFEKWRIAFEAEMMGEESVSSDKERSAQAASLLKPTGKALFSSNRAGMEDALLAAAEAEEACAAAAAAVASVTGGADAEGVVAAAGELFEEDDVDLDALEDLDFDDDDDDEDDEDYVDPYSP